jgi:hypothetical protein
VALAHGNCFLPSSFAREKKRFFYFESDYGRALFALPSATRTSGWEVRSCSRGERGVHESLSPLDRAAMLFGWTKLSHSRFPCSHSFKITKKGAERLIVDAAVELAERGHDVRKRTDGEREREKRRDFVSMFFKGLTTPRSKKTPRPRP